MKKLLYIALSLNFFSVFQLTAMQNAAIRIAGQRAVRTTVLRTGSQTTTPIRRSMRTATADVVDRAAAHHDNVGSIFKRRVCVYGYPIEVVSYFDATAYHKALAKAFGTDAFNDGIFDLRPVEKALCIAALNTQKPWKRHRGTVGLVAGAALASVPLAYLLHDAKKQNKKLG